MNKEEERILTTICMALPYMDDFSKGYLLATAEIFAKEKQKRQMEALSSGGDTPEHRLNFRS